MIQQCRTNAANNRKYQIGDTILRHGIPYVYINDAPNLPIDKRITKKSRYVWEQAHGPIPPKHRVIHLNNDPQDCDLNNLYLIPDRFVTTLNKNRWLSEDPAKTLAAIRYCELFYAVKDLNGKPNPQK